MDTAMKVTALAPWFGGKRNLAPRIATELGEHRVYWEPFCGSMAVIFAKPPCVMETVNDLHGDLVNLARVVQHGVLGPQLYRRLRRTLMVEELFDESGSVARSDFKAGATPDVERAFHYFVSAWIGRNGVAGTRSYNHHFCVRYTANGGHAAKRWKSAVDSIPAFRRRLRNVTILQRDAFDIIPRIIDEHGTSIYVDPPYVQKGAKYIHDFSGQEEHSRLAEQLRQFKRARVVVSYYDHPVVDRLYEGWTKIVIEMSKALANQGQRGKNDAKAREVLLINGPSFTAKKEDRDELGLFSKFQ